MADPLNQGSPAAHSILDIITRATHAGTCRSAIVETGYFDQEYSRAYQKFYSRSYPQFDRYSTRVHLFSLLPTRRDLSNLESRRWQQAYLGYCVVRPLHSRKIGRTVIKPQIADPTAEFPLTLSQFDVNLAGSRLRVGGSPFLEQDGGAAVCASAAIWMSTSMAGQRFGLPTSTPAEITELATGFPLAERVLGSAGLVPEEMENALRRMGYNSLFLGITDRRTALQAIHPYLEGGLAPILLLQQLGSGGHATVAVGHDYDTSLSLQPPSEVMWENTPIRFRHSSDWITSLLVHDDQRGAFRRLRFLEADGVPPDDAGCPVEIDMTYASVALNGGWQTSEEGRLWGAIIPVPPRISMTGIEAEEKAARLSYSLFHTLGTELPQDIVLRTYLARSNDFKRRARTRGLHRRVQNFYRSKSLPRWIWVTELCAVVDVTDIPANRRLITGEIILDGNGSTSNPDFVAIHLALDEWGYLALMKPTDWDVATALENAFYYRSAPQYEAW